MIVVYPMMASKSISENTLPGIAKMLEAYIAVYMQDEILYTLNTQARNMKTPKMKYKIKRGRILGESLDLSEGAPPPELELDVEPGTKEEEERKRKEEVARKKRDKEKQEIQKDMGNATYEREKEAQEKTIEKAEEELKSKGRKVDLRVSDKSISIEPTKIQIHTDQYGTQILGIKVVPYRVKSDVKLSHLITHDMSLKTMDALVVRLGRIVMGYILRFLHRGQTVTGSPKHDIIYRTTGQKGKTFVALDKNNDVDEYFLSKTSKINRLFKLGWGNFVLCDDVLQIAHFCLQSSKGMCEAMSYRMLYKTLGQSGIYEDLEDLKKQNSSIFKVSRKRFSKILGEAKSDEKLFNYQERQ
jgi:hypothetical protein